MASSSSTTFSLTLPSDLEIQVTRVFDFPRRLVFEAYTSPEHVRRWWGCRHFTMTVCDMDFRPGGAWRYVLREPEGQEHPFKGIYREIVPPERLVYTFIYDVEMIRDHEALETVTFEECDGKTTVTSTIRHKTIEAHNGHLHSGMEAGAVESLDRLEELLQTLV